MARRWAAKVDGNHGDIVNGLRKLGFSVESLASVGGGAPDILVGVGGAQNLLFELKMPKEKLNRAQVKWHRCWRGPVYVAHSLEEVLRTLYARGLISCYPMTVAAS